MPLAPSGFLRRFQEVIVASSTVENYIKQIYLQLQESSNTLLPMGRLAEVMNVVPGTATSMVKALAESGLVDYEPRTGLRLTQGGERLALHVLRRHRILELFLTNIVGFDWSEVHDEAEALEHVISERLLTRMDEMLGHPEFDPHGDPIPSAKGSITRNTFIPLADIPEGSEARLARVSDQQADFLQFLNRHGLLPDTILRMQKRDSLADSFLIEVAGGDTITLGSQAAHKILVDIDRPAS